MSGHERANHVEDEARLLEAREGHGLRKEGNILHHWKEILKFLSKKLRKKSIVINQETNDNDQVHSATIIYCEN